MLNINDKADAFKILIYFDHLKWLNFTCVYNAGDKVDDNGGGDFYQVFCRP